MPDRTVLRLGSWAAIIGALGTMVGNILHPRFASYDDPVIEQIRIAAESDIWVPVHLAIVLGIVFMLGGLVALRHSIPDELAGTLARFGLIAATAGATIGLVLVILDGVAARQLAQEWAAASPQHREVALGLVHANETINFALASLFNFVFAAATFILFGLAVALGGTYPRWLGWVAAGAGVLSVAAGTVQASIGEPTDASRVLTIIGPTVITLWLLVMGILLLRKSREVPVRAVGIETRGAA